MTNVAMASNTQSECVFVALGIQYAMAMHHIVICSLSGSTIFFHISHKLSNFRGGLWNIKCAFGFFLHLFSETFLIL